MNPDNMKQKGFFWKLSVMKIYNMSLNMNLSFGKLLSSQDNKKKQYRKVKIYECPPHPRPPLRYFTSKNSKMNYSQVMK